MLQSMFTGIVRGTFEVVVARHEDGLLRYAVDLLDYGANLEIGASVSIDGVCQTVVRIDGTVVHFDAIRETLDLTTLGRLSAGDRVSVERSARFGDEIGGHQVSGHVRGRGRVATREQVGANLGLRIEVPADWMRYLLPKGFVAVDGSSLTIGETTATTFAVHLIPETLRLTNLGDRHPGDEVNIELDPQTVAIVETVERVLRTREST